MKCRIAWILVLAAAACSGGGDELQFTVTFEDAEGLQPGQFVVYNGIRVGEVDEVDLDPSGKVVVRVRVYGKYRETLYREADFVIEKPGGLIDVSGERQLTVKDRSRERTPIEPGDVLEGSDGWIDRALGKLGDMAHGAGEYGRSVWDKAKEYANSPEAREFYEALKDAAARAKEIGAEGYREFMDETYPDLKAKALAFKEWLEREGHLEEAAKFWNDFLEWSKGLLGSEEDQAAPEEQDAPAAQKA